MAPINGQLAIEDYVAPDLPATVADTAHGKSAQPTVTVNPMQQTQQQQNQGNDPRSSMSRDISTSRRSTPYSKGNGKKGGKGKRGNLPAVAPVRG